MSKRSYTIPRNKTICKQHSGSEDPVQVGSLGLLWNKNTIPVRVLGKKYKTKIKKISPRSLMFLAYYRTFECSAQFEKET